MGKNLEKVQKRDRSLPRKLVHLACLGSLQNHEATMNCFYYYYYFVKYRILLMLFYRIFFMNFKPNNSIRIYNLGDTYLLCTLACIWVLFTK